MISTDKIARAALRSSLLWGAVASLGFYVGLQQAQDWVSPLVMRFAAGRWESYACVAMFFVGLAAVIIKAIDVGCNWFYFQRMNLGAVPAGETSVTTTGRAVLKILDGQPRLCQSTYLCRRLREAFDFVLRKGGLESCEGHLRYLADIDAARMNTSYGLPRFLCWAIPAVGSLGAVLGIAAAIGQLPPTTIEPSAVATAAPTEIATGVSAGLALAFDTMALAIGLSIVLMLLKFACEQAESQLLDAVEDRVEREVNTRVVSQTARGPQPDAMRQVVERLGELTSKLSQSPAAMPSVAAGQAGMSADQLEAIVSRMMSKAGPSQPQVSFAGGGQLTDMSQVQDALKQIAAFFSIQQAEHQQESEIVKQLSEIIREGDTGSWKPRKEKESMAGSLAGLWNSLSD